MQYSKKDYEVLGKQVAAGRYVSVATCALALVLALLAGICLGRYVFPDSGPGAEAAGAKRPLSGDSGLAAAVNPKQQLLQSIFQHEEELRRDPSNGETWEHLGNLYFDADEPTKAVNAYNKALELNPGNTSVLVDCGVMYRQLKLYDKALEYFQRALRIDAKHENALFNSGVVLYFDMQRKEEALKVWRELVNVNPDARTPSGEPVSTMLETLP
jgi:tetratricopeptide (TPR) repeat protein